MKIRLTLEEAERLAYIEGATDTAATLAAAIDDCDEDGDALISLSEVYCDLG